MSIVELRVPTIGESITEVTLSAWLKEDGEYVHMDEAICEFESDKATLEFPSEASGQLIYVAAEGDDLEIGALVAKIDTSVEAPQGGSSDKGDTSPAEPEESIAESEEKPTAPSPSEKESDKVSYASGHPSPAAHKILDEKGIDPSSVAGTGKEGRITKADAESAVKSTETKSPAKPEKSTKSDPVEAGTGIQSTPFSREERVEKMSRMRRTIARRLVSAKNNTAMLTTFNEADMSEILKLRKTYQEKFVEKYGIKLGFMSIFAKACAVALQEMPDVNARIEDENLVYHDYVDISIAISTPNGLVVPPVHNVESLAFHQIENKIKELADKAREGKLSLEEMTGGTFTITNGGIFGSMLSTPILNEPQSAILGMHNIIQRPVAVNGEVQIRPMMYLALSYDHRVIDGSTSVTFLVRVKELLENPVQLLMGI